MARRSLANQAAAARNSRMARCIYAGNRKRAPLGRKPKEKKNEQDVDSAFDAS